MSEIKKYYWLLTVLGGMISLIGLTIPVWYSSPTWIEYIWIAGIIRHVSAGDVLDILPPEMFIPSIIVTILILLSSGIFIIIGIFKFKGKKFFINTEILWIIVTILEVFAMIGYFFGIQYGFYQHTGIDFWSIYQIQLGFFSPFIGAGLSLIGIILGKVINRDRN